MHSRGPATWALESSKEHTRGKDECPTSDDLEHGAGELHLEVVEANPRDSQQFDRNDRTRGGKCHQGVGQQNGRM